ncbi:MAG: peptidase [Pseudomonadota bacterium]
MSYCIAMALDEGMIFASDSRTNAGVDHIGRFCKMRVFERPRDRVITIVSAGNLSITQNAINLLELRSKGNNSSRSMFGTDTMFDVASLLGDCVREVRRRDGPYLIQGNVDTQVSFLIGGQIRKEQPRLFNVYAEGNFIEATVDTPYFQIGETKYGKPILDRVITSHTSLMEGAKCTLVSFDSTMRSNISVGPPIDLLVYERDALKVGVQRRIDEADPYFNRIHTEWGEGVKRLFSQLPNPNWDDSRS